MDMKVQKNQPELWEFSGMPGEISEQTSEPIAGWKDLQYGMFIHWGLFSKFGGGEVDGNPVEKGYSEQIQMWANLSETDYLQAAKVFYGDAFDPEAICTLAKNAGMSYIVITSKHHDGFCMFDTETTDYNIVKQTPFGKDSLKLLSEECKRQGLKFGVYFSLVDWHQGHIFDENNNNSIPIEMEPVIERQLHELMTNYGAIVEVWFDMGKPTLIQSEKFKKIVMDLQPNAAVNSRIWNNLGDFRTLGDNQIPKYTLDNPWQTPASIYHETWGYRNWQAREDMTGKVKNLIKGLTSVRARGGNYLLNIGPKGDGSIVLF
ncbi:alpha-L-fucosidase [Virgibacillus halophilus]|uniref:alpha-L-fucosidase n=1 Tax=Tigheibacillus halophilus TaxID=361280 RepID=A0ABU5C358_9BACI|nr:alpha-L-fucosidase [Virgibacillus halophilus]